MDNEEKSLQQKQPDISLKQPSAPTFIGDHTNVSFTIQYYQQPQVFSAIYDQPSNDEIEQLTLNQVQDEDQTAIYDQPSNDEFEQDTLNQVQDEDQIAIYDQPSNDEFEQLTLNQVQDEDQTAIYDQASNDEFEQLTLNQVQNEDQRDVTNNDGYLKPINKVQEQIAQIEKRNQQNDQEGAVARNPPNSLAQIKKRNQQNFNNQENIDVARKEPEEKSFFCKVDEEIKKLPYTSFPLLEVLSKKISQTQSTATRVKLIKRTKQVLQIISGRDCFQKNTCGIYEAEATFRQLLLYSDHEKVLECISAYAGILSVILKNGHLLQDLIYKNSLKPLLSDLRKRLSSPHIMPYTRIRRDVKAVIKMLSKSIGNPRSLENLVQFIYKIQTITDTSKKKVGELCKSQLKTRSWFQHFLIISWLTMEILREEKANLLRILLQVISYYANQFCQQREKYQWKFTLTVVENLTEIVKIVPDFAEIAIVGNADEGLPGLVDFFRKIVRNKKCENIFNQHGQSLAFIENGNLRHRLLTGIFSGLEVSSEEIVKERVNNSQSLQNMVITKTVHHGKNTWIMSGHFENSAQVVAKIYKIRREQLTSSRSFEAAKNAPFANELSMLSHLRTKSHPNIVKLIACDEELPCIVLNYVSKGCLLQFLRRCRSGFRVPKVTDLLHMIVQMTDALAFLEKEQVIHLGIMAENVLLDENFHVFLTGFQSSCKREIAANLRRIVKHVKWMDPEGLYGQPVSHSTDVWSLGVIMYEIFTYGCVPYNNPMNNLDEGDFERMPMTASQTKGFVHRGGMLPNQPCIPEKVFQIISTKCFVPRATRASATVLKSNLIEVKERMENSTDIPLPSPPQLCLFEEDVVSANYDEKYKAEITYIEEHNEGSSFTYLDKLDAVWNEEYNTMLDDNIYDKETHPAHTSNEPFLCRYREHDNCQTKLIVLEYKELRDYTLAKKLRDLNCPFLVNVLAVNPFVPQNLEMMSESFPLGNVLSAILSFRSLREHLLLYLIQAASAVVYLHENGIVHRHLKAENILMEHETQVKLGRLGFVKEEETLYATYMDEYTLNKSNFAAARWNPTEVVKHGCFSKKSDYWSFGIVCWELSQASISQPGTRTKDILPYKELTDDQVFREIERGGRLTEPSSSMLYNIYKGFWEHEPEKRMPIHLGRDKLQKLFAVCNKDAHGYVQERLDTCSSNSSSMEATTHEQELSNSATENVYWMSEELYDIPPFQTIYGNVTMEQSLYEERPQSIYEDRPQSLHLYEESEGMPDDSESVGSEFYDDVVEILPKDQEKKEIGKDADFESQWVPVSKVHRDKYEKLLKCLQDPENSLKIRNINGVRVCFEEEFRIGEGADGTSVYIGLSEDGYERAVKRLLKNVTGKLGLQEKKILNTLNAVDSKCILRYWFYDQESDPTFAYLILDLCEETLEQYVKDQSQEKLIKNAPFIIRQMLDALDDLHRKPEPVLHRDLKPSNIMRSVNDKWLLADFGLSRILHEGQTSHQSVEKGTKFWRAVESYPTKAKGDSDSKVRFKKRSDIQAAGMVAYHVLTKGEHAFGPERDCLANLLDGNPAGLKSLKDPAAKEFISWMLEHKPEDRPYAHEALQHPYLLPPDEQFELLKCVGNELEIIDTKASDVAKKINADPLLAKRGWISCIDINVLRHVCGGHPYPNRWAQCLRFIRNTSVHWNDKDKPAAVQNVVGEPQDYFLKLFPTLPVVVHRIIRNDRDWKGKGTLKKFFS